MSYNKRDFCVNNLAIFFIFGKIEPRVELRLRRTDNRNSINTLFCQLRLIHLNLRFSLNLLEFHDYLTILLKSFENILIGDIWYQIS